MSKTAKVETVSSEIDDPTVNSIDHDAATGLAVASQEQSVQSETLGGHAMKRVMTMKDFASADWILKNCVVHGVNTKTTVARIIGACTGAEIKMVEWQGKSLKTIALSGTFEGQSFATGEIVRSTIVYLPLAYAEHVSILFMDENVKIIEVDLDVGVRATGKAIPYEWTCTSFVETGESHVLTRLRNRRNPIQQMTLEHQPEPKRIAAG